VGGTLDGLEGMKSWEGDDASSQACVDTGAASVGPDTGDALESETQGNS
jgi:hypothetical protein